MTQLRQANRVAAGLLSLLAFSAWAQPFANLIQTPVVPNASPQARALLHYLQNQRGQHILSGQVEDTENILWNKDGQGGKEIPFIHRITGTNLEAEAATALGGVSLVTYTNANFTGWGYADLSGKNGTNYIVRWNISLASATDSPLTFRFANGSTSTRSLHLIINGATNSTLTFPPTGSWNLFSNCVTPSINFPAGATVIDLVTSVGTTGPNIDKLEADFPNTASYEAENAVLEGGVAIARVTAATPGRVTWIIPATLARACSPAGR